MFARRLFPARYFAPRYFPRGGPATAGSPGDVWGERGRSLRFRDARVRTFAGGPRPLAFRDRRQAVFTEPQRGLRFRDRRDRTFAEERRGNIFRRDDVLTLTKRPGESRRYGFDFGDFPEVQAGGTLTGTPSVSADVAGLTIGTPSVSGTQVVVRISGGTDGSSFKLTCAAGTSGTDTLVVPGQLKVSAYD